MREDAVERTRHAAAVAELEEQSGTARTLFDVRTVIGGLFLLYGLLIGGAGLFPTEDGLAKSQGININLWTGLAMVVVGALFVLWVWRRPLKHDNAE
ncbi:hypothetical protein MOQ72_12020 [Saccharopolyspora sp. K220]|uniref:hypothetical protein n=1 Tax=Saccharopolyspora soli TaxID=2926618 RepID=UPI001F5A6592|nr:hypothetical protein [Saccharopolyspora soli]MCI2418155.1 hypothetical protein [Saccharopolyspora soli]